MGLFSKLGEKLGLDMGEKEEHHTVNANKGDELNLTSQGPGKNIRTLNANVGSTINFGGDGP